MVYLIEVFAIRLLFIWIVRVRKNLRDSVTLKRGGIFIVTRRVTMNISEVFQKFKDPLYKNSIFLILSNITGSGSGFVFWIIATRLYLPTDIGLASALVSAIRMISQLSILGLDLTLVRFIPEKEDKISLVMSALVVSSLISILFSFLFIISVDIIAPQLGILKKDLRYLMLYFLFVISLTLTGILGQGVFVAFRKTEYTLMQNLIILIRLFILPLLTSFGAFGIFISFGSGTLLASLFALILATSILIHVQHTALKKPKFKEIKDMIPFSLGVYIVRIIELAPTLLLPIIVLNMLGAEQNAYFFVAWSVMLFITMIPKMTSLSLLAEGSHEPQRLKERTIESFKFSFLLTSMVVLLIYVFGAFVLNFFGKEYSERSLYLLRILLVGCLPYSFNIIYAGSMMVKKRIKSVILIYGSISLITILSGYFLMMIFGIMGVGYSWVLGNFITMVGVLVRHYVR